MKNYKILYGLRILKEILDSFVDSFFVLYFIEVSSGNILPLGIYKLVAVTAIYAVIFLSRNFCKSKHRIILMRIGIVLDLVYFLTIIILKEQIVNYMYVIGLIYGLEEGFYYSVFNNFESDGIANEDRAKYQGTYTTTKAIFEIIFPLIFGTAIYTIGFTNSIVIALVMVILRMILSILFKDNNVPKSNKTDMKKYWNLVNKDDRVKNVLKVNFYRGLTYSGSTFSYIVTIYIIKIFSNSLSLGIFTSIFSGITAIIGILFAKWIKKHQYKSLITISMALTIISLCVMVYKCTMITVIIFNLFQTISKNLQTLIVLNTQSNLSNIKQLKKDYKVEYWLSCETTLFLGRALGCILFILMAFMESDIMIYVFIVFLILLAKDSIQLQEAVEKKSGENMNKKLLVSDYDNTFYINDNDIKENIEKVEEFRRNGNIFVIATGRGYPSFSNELKKYPIKYDYLVINHGATILDYKRRCS